VWRGRWERAAPSHAHRAPHAHAARRQGPAGSAGRRRCGIRRQEARGCAARCGQLQEAARCISPAALNSRSARSRVPHGGSPELEVAPAAERSRAQMRRGCSSGSSGQRQQQAAGHNKTRERHRAQDCPSAPLLPPFSAPSSQHFRLKLASSVCALPLAAEKLPLLEHKSERAAQQAGHLCTLSSCLCAAAVCASAAATLLLWICCTCAARRTPLLIWRLAAASAAACREGAGGLASSDAAACRGAAPHGWGAPSPLPRRKLLAGGVACRRVAVFRGCRSPIVRPTRDCRTGNSYSSG